MKRALLYTSLTVAVLSILVIGFVYMQNSQDLDSDSVESEFVGGGDEINPIVDVVFDEVETTIFVSDDFAFQHPTEWSPFVLGEEGSVNLGIPLQGILRQEINYRNGNYDEVVASTGGLPNLSGQSELYILDSQGFARTFYDENADRQTLEYFRPGRVSGEIVVMEVEIDRSQLVEPGLEPYLEELFVGLTLVN